MPTNRSSAGGGYPPTASHLTALGRPSTSFSADTLPSLLLIGGTAEPFDSSSMLTAPFTHAHIHDILDASDTALLRQQFARRDQRIVDQTSLCSAFYGG